MTTSTINLTAVDFETIKSNLKTYLKGQTRFKDVDFDASNINVLLDVLAYNSFHNSFYLNMIASEMFLKSAQLDNNISAHANALNYLPRSYKSAVAIVDITVEPENPSSIQSILIPKGTSFTGRANSKVYTFTTSTNVVILNNNDTFVAESVELNEGRYISEVYTYRSDSRYVLSNATVDISSIVVAVTDSGVTTEYTQADNFADIDSTSEVYFIQSAENRQYELLFGDGVFGKQISKGATIVVEYRLSSGELPNTASEFECDGTLGGTSNITITTVSAASGGAIAETNESIKFRAPLMHAAQQRAVTPEDYRSLILNEFPDIVDVGVYGGETIDPPRFGHVALVPINEDYGSIADSRKQDVLTFIKQKCSPTITPIILAAETVYVQMNTNVSYDYTSTTKSTSDISLLVLAAIQEFNINNVEGFNNTLRYSKLLSVIDAADSSILGNTTKLSAYKLLQPDSTVAFSATINTYQALLNLTDFNCYPHSSGDTSCISSSAFTYKNLRCFIEDNGAGKLNVVAETNGTRELVESGAGTVNYETGTIIINMDAITGYEGRGIKLFFTPAVDDISALYNNVIVVRDSDIVIEVTPTRG